MGTFYARCKLENPSDRSRSVVIPKLLVDTGSELTWVSVRMLERIGIGREKKDLRFVLANGQEVTRSVGFAIIRLDKYFTIDEVVFAEPGDLQLLGAHTLEGLNLIIEPARRRLMAAGPFPPHHPPVRNELHTAANSSLSQNRGSSVPGSRLEGCRELWRSARCRFF
jgi:predicted aspartyl protease